MECRICEYSADGKCLYYGGEHGDHCRSCSKYQKQSYEVNISYSTRKGKDEMVSVCVSIQGKKLRSSNFVQRIFYLGSSKSVSSPMERFTY